MARDPDAKLDTPTFFKHDIERIAKESVAPIVADLVDKAIDDGRINIDDNVQRIIQADKDILSQIVYDEEEHTLTFPKGIMPLSYYNSDSEITFYFDYYNGKVLNEDGTVHSTLSFDNEQVSISVDISLTESDSLDYCLFNCDPQGMNTYYLYNPITSAGTKLYRHTIGYGTLPNRQEIIFISTGNGNGTQPYVDLLNNIGEILKITHLYYISENMQKESTDVIVPGVLNGSFPYVIGTLILWNTTSSAFEKTVVNLFSHGTTVTHTVEEL